MIESAKDLASDLLEADICIVGTGAAGIPLALELAESGQQVLLIESGGFKESKEVQALYEGGVVDEAMHSPSDKFRQRRFGGSTTIWGGRCMPFDPIDFEQRDYIPGSGWPISYDDLAPFYPKAHEYLELGQYEYDARKAFNPPAAPMFKGYEGVTFSTEGLERFSRPTDVGKCYRDRIEKSSAIRCLTDLNITYIQLQQDGSRVEHLDAKTLNGKSFKITASKFILAMGGIEIPRLMLASKDVQKQGIGNDHDILGRFYMCHIAGNVGSLQIKGPVSNVTHGYEVSPDGIYCRRRIQLKPNKQKELGVSNMVARLHFPKITDPSHKSGILSGLFVVRKLISYEYSKRLKDGENASIGLYLRHFWNILTGPVDTVKFLYHWLTKRTLAKRKFPSIILPNKNNNFSLEIHAEQIPIADSRITILKEKDTLGVPKVCIDWKYCKQDVELVKKTLKAFAEDISAQGIGEFKYDEQDFENELMRFGAYGGHHIGATRMGDDPQTSVVDKNCQVHGINNLFIASCSVFPTSSQANPTLIFALTHSPQLTKLAPDNKA
jgi:choline dehydrogenase-like flavoprotein